MGVKICAFIAAAFAIVNAGLITNLPGAPKVSFNQYAGYYDVGKNHHMHYWFTESQNDPAKDPVILWLTGGPGCSGISALLTEIGPLFVNPNGATLSVNPYAWNRKANLLILESPAGVGYSYVSSGTLQTDDEQVSIENREALVAFFKEFPQYQKNDFYVTGESYAGMYVPTLVQKILDGQTNFKINIKGLAIGNGLLNDDDDTDTLIQFAYNHGMVDEKAWEKVNIQCCNGSIDGCAFHKFNGWDFCSNFVSETTENCWFSGINPYNMYASCNSEDPFTRKKRFFHEAYMRTGKRPPISVGAVVCMNETASITYLNRQDVRNALFVPPSLPAWDICNDQIGEYYGHLYGDMTSRIKNAVAAGLRVLIYNGDVDMACNFLMGQRFVEKLGYAEVSPKQPFHVDGQVGGFYTVYNKITFITVKGSGHMVPTDKPSVAYYMLDAFLNNRSL